MKKRIAAALPIAGALLWVGAPAQADGPKWDVFNANDAVWGCSGDPGVLLPPFHCINLQSRGDTGLIMVFDPDTRWPQESISTNPLSDSRPCPQDAAATDGTWWSPLPGVWVCHHRP